MDTVESNGIEKTIIINQTDINQKQIQGIKDTLQKGEIQKSTSANSSYDVIIVLGKDYEE